MFERTVTDVVRGTGQTLFGDRRCSGQMMFGTDDVRDAVLFGTLFCSGLALSVLTFEDHLSVLTFGGHLSVLTFEVS